MKGGTTRQAVSRCVTLSIMSNTELSRDERLILLACMTIAQVLDVQGAKLAAAHVASICEGIAQQTEEAKKMLNNMIAAIDRD